MSQKKSLKNKIDHQTKSDFKTGTEFEKWVIRFMESKLLLHNK